MKLPEIKIEINGITYDHTFDTDVKIDRTNLEDEFSTQAEKYAFYAFLSEDAKYLESRRKAELEQLYATLDGEKRNAALAVQAQNPKWKYTEKMCESEIKTDKRYRDKQQEFHEAQRLTGQLVAATRAISQRKDMLMQLGANNRVAAVPARILDEQKNDANEVIRRQPRGKR